MNYHYVLLSLVFLGFPPAVLYKYKFIANKQQLTRDI